MVIKMQECNRGLWESSVEKVRLHNRIMSVAVDIFEKIHISLNCYRVCWILLRIADRNAKQRAFAQEWLFKQGLVQLRRIHLVHKLSARSKTSIPTKKNHIYRGCVSLELHSMLAWLTNCSVWTVVSWNLGLSLLIWVHFWKNGVTDHSFFVIHHPLCCSHEVGEKGTLEWLNECDFAGHIRSRF